MHIQPLVEAYLHTFPEDASNLTLLIEQSHDGEALNRRDNFTGHLTASGLVLSSDFQCVLLIHNRAFGKWIEPGGHCESYETSTVATARREVAEETGVQNMRYCPLLAAKPEVPLFLSSYYIPANTKKDEPEHYHHDFRYVFVADKTALVPQLEEVAAARWFTLDAPEAEESRPVLERASKLLGL